MAEALADDTTIAEMYKMYMKIGALGELPEKDQEIKSYLSDMWNTMYIQNHIVPDDIPFDVIITAFKKAIILGDAKRKGNNQAAICQAFNTWVTSTEVKNGLYQVRDQKYPHQKPKQVAQDSTMSNRRIPEWTDDELLEVYKMVQTLYGDESGAKMLAGFDAKNRCRQVAEEVKKRGLV